jgi:hypothetical protein
MSAFDPFKSFPNNGPDSCEVFQDFTRDGAIEDYVCTNLLAGTFTVVDTLAGGAAKIAAVATTDNCGAIIQRNTAWLALTTSKTHRFRARVYLGETTSANVEVQSDLWVGFGTHGAMTAFTAPTDGIYFRKDDGSGTLYAVVYAAGVAILNAPTSISMASATWYRLDISVQVDSVSGTGTVTFYVDGVAVASLTTATLPLQTIIMSEFWGFLTGDNTGTKYGLCDYLGGRLER